MINNGIVRGSAEQAVPFIANGENIYIHNNIKEVVTEQGTTEYEYLECIYSKDEYFKILNDQSNELMILVSELVGIADE